MEELLASNVPIGTIYRSDSEYLLDRLLADHQDKDGKPARKTYFHDMLQMAVWFGARTLPAAVLPEPYVSYIATYHPPGGAPVELVIHDDFSEVGVLPSVIVFDRGYVTKKPDAIAAFYAAYVEAIERINATPRDDLIDLGIDIALSLFFQGADRTTINQEVLDTIPIPIFDSPTVLPRSDYEGILAWMLEKGYVYRSTTYEESTDFQFIQ
jgi:NitT/TauT family transport system substrate-binding protein